MSAALYGLGVLGIVPLQLIGSASVVGFIRRNSHGESRWGTLIAPAIAAVGLSVALVLSVRNYSLLTGSDLYGVNHLPWLLPCAAVLGAFVARPPGRRRPQPVPGRSRTARPRSPR